jgi:hypothetical protein
VKRFLDQRPWLAGVFFVVGLSVAVGAVVYAGRFPTVKEFSLAFIPAFAGSWVASNGMDSLIRVRRGRRTGVET